MQNIFVILFISIFLLSCVTQEIREENNYDVKNCAPVAGDSIKNEKGVTITNNSASKGIFKTLTIPRQSKNGLSVTVDYVVYPPTGIKKGLIVLIAGGTLNSIKGGAQRLSKNFLVRSAALYAAEGYKVLTINRPSDFEDYIDGDIHGHELDDYRISVAHAVDISGVINTETDIDNAVPTIIAGTSRGTISAIAHSYLADILLLSSPVTDGNNGRPIGSGNIDAIAATKPVHLMWHQYDDCRVTPPSGSAGLLNDFKDVQGHEIVGGFNDPKQSNACQANTNHGFLGIETCAVKLSTNYIAGKMKQIISGKLTTRGDSGLTAKPGESIKIDLSKLVTTKDHSALKYSLPANITTQGNKLSLVESIVNYDPILNTKGKDAFVYVVEEVGGGSRHNVISINVN